MFRYLSGWLVRLKSVIRVSLIKYELVPDEYVDPQRAIESVGRSLLDRNGSREARYEFQTRNHTHSSG